MCSLDNVPQLPDCPNISGKGQPADYAGGCGPDLGAIGAIFGSSASVDDEVFAVSSHTIYRNVARNLGLTCHIAPAPVSCVTSSSSQVTRWR